jgi:hypothetical protein
LGDHSPGNPPLGPPLIVTTAARRVTAAGGDFVSGRRTTMHDDQLVDLLTLARELEEAERILATVATTLHDLRLKISSLINLSSQHPPHNDFDDCAFG